LEVGELVTLQEVEVARAEELLDRDEDARAALPQDVRRLGALEARVQRHQHAARHLEPDGGEDPAARVRRPDGDAVAVAQARRAEGARGAQALLRELRERPAAPRLLGGGARAERLGGGDAQARDRAVVGGIHARATPSGKAKRAASRRRAESIGTVAYVP